MSVEERLYALAQQYRQLNGDAALRSPAQLTAQLSSQAPDLHGEIRALVAAIAGDTVSRVAAAPDAATETMTVAAEIAGRERLSMAVATAGVGVALRLGPIGASAGAAMPAAAGGSGWAGETMVAQPVAAAQPYQPVPQAQPSFAGAAAETPATPTATEPVWQNKWLLGVAAAAVAFFVYQSNRAPTPQQGPAAQGPQVPPGPQAPQRPDTPRQDPQTPPGPQAGNSPLLQPPGGNLPTIAVTQGPNGMPALAFMVQTQNGPAQATVLLPAQGGWDGGPVIVGFARAGQSQAETFGQALAQRVTSDGGPARAVQPQWERDGLGMGPVCIGFQNQGQTQTQTQSVPNDQPNQSGQGGDVQLSGATMCVMDGACQQAAGCGRIQ